MTQVNVAHMKDLTETGRRVILWFGLQHHAACHGRYVTVQ